jgi:hypothetical protein
MLRRFASAFPPALPASIGANLALTAGDDVQVSAVSDDAYTLAGYDAVRGNVGAAISEAFLGARSPAAIARISKSSAATVTGGGW